MTTTLKRLESLTARIDKLCREIGLIGPIESTHLHFGSKFNGIAFRLYTLREGSTAHWRHPASTSDGYLGMTKPEADRSLGIIADVLASVCEHRDRSLPRPNQDEEVPK